MSIDATDGWGPSVARCPWIPKGLPFAPPSDSRGPSISSSSLRDAHRIEIVGRTYPVWLNALSAIALGLVPLGGFLIVLREMLFGGIAIAAGFLGVWICGEIGSRVGRNVTRTRTYA